jgi:PAS domain S-box-containing protein
VLPGGDWVRTAKRFWRRITHAGVTPRTPSALRKRLIVTNLFGLTVGSITLFWFAIYTIFWVPILKYFMFVIVACGAAVPWMNSRGYFVASRLMILGVSSVMGAAYALVMGPEAGIVIMFLPLVCAPLALFDLRERALMAVALPFPVMVAVAVQWYQVDHPPLGNLPREVIDRAAGISLVTATVLVAAMMRFLYAVHASAEERLEQSYHELLRQSDEVVLFVARDGRIIDANQQIERQLGHARARLVNAPIWTIDASLTEADWGALVARLEAGPALVHHKYRRRDGGAYPVEVRLGLVGEGTGCVIVAARDISQRTELEARLRVADRLVSVGTLAAGVAHEINNPLTYITLNLERVLRRITESQRALCEPHRHEVLESLQMALEGTAKVSAIVSDLKTFSRGSQQERSAVDIERVLLSTLKLASLELRSRAEVVTDFAAVPPVWGNEARLAQVALNLFLNAAQAMDRGGSKHNLLRVSTGTDALGGVVVRVSDNGCGIPEADLARIFDPFFTTKHAEGGTGLGLYVCRSIVTESGGEITVSSQSGQGTTFQLTLPAAHSVRSAPDFETPGRGNARPLERQGTGQLSHFSWSRGTSGGE